MTPSVATPIHTQLRTIDGVSIRFAESEPRDTHALLLSPWPESLYTPVQIIAGRRDAVVPAVNAE
jgi:hypothetical protein